ncbi:MAG: autotransporter domain-containing protein, partial [Acidaminococcaceae bacterium]|nr:autotransporter domain-containing protein [Acidaminococcaceae bacterium]
NTAVTTDNQDDVLNALAGKLWYTNYADNHLAGTVKIAEGLTASSAAKKTGAISFSTATTGTNQEGQGYYAYTPLVEQLGNTIYGLADKDKKYVKEGIRQEDGTYKFTSDYTVAAVDSDVTTEDLGYNKAVGAVIANGNDITLDARGHQLTLKADSTAVSVQAIGLYSNKKVTVTADQLNVEATADKGDAEGLYVHAGGDVTINGNVSVKATQKADGSAVGINMYNDGSKLSINGNLTMKGEGDGYGVSTAQKGGYGTKKYDAKGIYMYDRTGGSVTVTGDTDMAVKGTGIDMRGSKKNIIDLQGKTTILTPIDKTDDSGSFEAINGAKGTLYIGMNAAKNGASDKDVKIQGKIYDSDAVLNIGLGTADSKWTGYVDKSDYGNGSMNLYLANGGTWDNQQTVKESVFNGSRISKLTGGSDADHAGVIFQNDSKPVTVDNYSGNTTVIYKHSIVDDTARTNHALYGDKAASVTGGDFKVTSAAAGSAITLLTDANGVDTDSTVYTDKNLVSDVLDKLANKLFFTNHASGNLSGTVKIAEGLTASSAVKKVGTISFSTTSTGTKTDGQGYYAYTLEEEPVSYKTGPIKETEDINVTRQAEANGDVNVKATNVTVTDGSYKYVSTMFAGDSSYTKSNPMVVDLNGHNLNLNAASQSNVASAIYVTDNADIKVNGSEGKKVSIHASNSDTRAANGILVKGRYAELSMDGPVEIKDISTVGDSAAGISVSSQNSSVSVSGNLTIDKVYGVRERGDGINASGIAVTGDNSKVNVTGLVDIKGVKGSSLKTVGKDTEISVGGGTITAEKDSQKNYYAVRVDKGTININMDNGAAGANTAKITGDMFVTGQYGKKVIEYSGGELIDWSDAGKLNVALTNGDSFWTGAAVYDQYNSDYGSGGNTMHDIGEFNLYLQNGAAWTNEKQSHGTTTTVSSAAWTGSQLAKLTGGSDADHAGVIYQNDTNPISVNSYSGNTTVIYKHEIVDDTAREKAAFYGNKAASVIGGDFKITNAAEGSAITLRTDSDGLNLDSSLYTDKNLVNDTLDKLANKLWYTNYSDGHLTGKVEIAEGLTASSVSKRLEDITFSTPATGTKQEGQGYYAYTPASDTPSEQTTTEFSQTITGDAAKDQVYTDSGVRQTDGTYKFTKDSAITLTGGASAVNVEKDVVVNAQNQTLTMTTKEGTGTVYGINQSTANKAEINADKLVLDVKSTSRAEGIHMGAANSNPALTINGDVDMTVDGTANTLGAYIQQNSTLTVNGNLKMKVDGHNGGFSYYGSSGLYGTSAMSDTIGGTIIVNGDVDLSGSMNGIFVNAGGAKATINGGGTISVDASKNPYAALRAENGVINMNVERDADGAVTGASNHKVNIKGNVDVTCGAVNSIDVHGTLSQINLGLGTADSTLQGVVYNAFPTEGITKNGVTFKGESNLWLANGATWTNEKQGKIERAWTGNNFAGSVVTNFHGGSDADHAGVIFQNDSNPITVDNYSGNTTVIYKHDAANPQTINGGDFKITNAATGSAITLLTDSDGITTGFASTDEADAQNNVSEVLNKLANKLWYTNYSNGNLTGTVKIAEGLTASSAAKKTGAISFSTATTGTKQEGQGYYKYDLAYPDSQVTDPMDKSIDGSEDSEKAYHDAGIYKPGDDEYKFTKNPATVNGDKPSVVDGTNKDLTLKGETLNLNAQDGGTGINASDGKTVNVDNKVNITAPNGTGVKADGAGSAVNLKNGGSVQNAQTGVKADNGGSVTIGQPLDINATGHAVEAGSGAKVDLTGGTMKGGVKATGDGTEVKLNGNNESNTTKLEGGVDTGAGATVTGNFRGNGSGLEGDVTGGGTANVNVGNGASWTGDDKSDADGTTNVQVGNGGTWKGDSAGSGTANVTIADNGTWNGASTNAGTDVNLSGTWKPTGDSTVGSLTGNGGTLDKADAGSGKTTINHYSGTTNVVYGHDASNPTQIIGGSVEIGTADSGSKINLITDNTGLNPGSGKAADKNKVSETLNQMAHKLTYSGYGNNPQNLTGSLKIAEGLTAGSANLRAEALSFDSNGVGQYNYTPETNDTPIEYGDYETKLMKGAKEAMLGAIALWRSNNNDLQRRMGDLRLSKEENGIWARYLGGKNLMDGQNTKLDSRYNIYQVGYDRKVGDWTVGAALDHGKSSDSLSDGHGDGELTTLSFYGSLLKQDGQYLDIIARGSHVKDDYTVRGELGHKLDGDYKTWGLSLSAEYGKRFTQDNGFYFDPSVELTIGRLDSKDYDATSDFAGNKKMHISQDAFNSAIGRIGFGIGQELEKSNYFAKLALAHEFGGDVDTTFSAENEPTKSTHIDLGDTWYELELGGTAQLNKNTYLYGTYTRNFGAELENKWRVDAGLRFSF